MSINKKFAIIYDKWDKTNIEGFFILGTTSKVLQSIGLEKRNIILDKTKIVKIKNCHSEMTDNIIKQIPNIIENPILVLNSLSASNINKNRIILFGDLLDINGNPILVAMELNPIKPSNKVYKIASAYGKENINVIQIWLKNENNILYITKDKKRITKWLNGLGLQLPVPYNNSNSNEINIPY